jgi:hypothetical protein
MAYCPSCAHEIAVTVEKCPKCQADFTAKDGWKPVETSPLAPPPPPPPLTKADKVQGAVIILSFIVWLPVYLFIVRPILNSYIADHVDRYPAMLHLIPIFLVPVAFALMVKWWGKSRRNERAP